LRAAGKTIKDDEMIVGIELSGISASDRSRGFYLKDELARLNFNTSIVSQNCVVDVRIMLKRDFGRIKANGERLIFDVSDAILTPPRSSSAIKRIYRKIIVNPRVGQFLSQCNAIVVASELQRLAMKKYNSQVFVIPDSSFYHYDYMQQVKPAHCDRIVFVWDGQGHNIGYLESIIKKNVDFFKKEDVFLKVVTDRYNSSVGCDNAVMIKKYGVNAEFIEWKSENFMDEVNKAHVGLAPVDMKCAHAMAKPDNKMVNYQGMGLPVIASATPAYEEFSKRSPGGVMVCRTDDDWRNALEYWRINRQQALTDGLLGRVFVIEKYAPEVLSRKWKEIIDVVANAN
jgi:glycosyltransferase involved in cell wall biosynthesis